MDSDSPVHRAQALVASKDLSLPSRKKVATSVFKQQKKSGLEDLSLTSMKMQAQNAQASTVEVLMSSVATYVI